MRLYQDVGRQNSREYRGNYRDVNYNKEVGVGLGKGHFQEIIKIEETIEA